MGKRLCSVGIDVGTTTTQLVFSHLTVENQASQFSVPQMQITDRQIVYRSPVHFTPLLEGDLVDAPRLRSLVEQDYRSAGLTPAQVDTGAIIITGETSRKQNARAVLRELSGFAGEFVVTTAGPELESVLASRGAGAWELAKHHTRPVLHMDIGGGTSNLALLQGETLLAAGCMNVGGRLVTQKNATTNERKTRRARKRRKKTRSAITRKHRTKTQSRKRYATTKAERTRPVLGPSGGLIVCSALFVAPRQAKSWRIRVFMTVFYFSEELRKRDGLICFSDSRFGFRRAVFFLTIVRDRKCWHKKSRASKSSGNAGRLPQRRILPVVNTPDL